MSRVGVPNGTNTVITDFADGVDEAGTYDAFTAHRLDNRQELVVATSGSGKSNLINLKAWNRKMHGATVVYLTEKRRGGELENCYCAFPPIHDFHKALMMQHNTDEDGNPIIPAPYPDQPQRIKVYHPFTFRLPRRLPSCIVPITFPLRHLTEDVLTSILAVGSGVDSKAVRMCKNSLDRLKPHDDIYTFLRGTYEAISSDVIAYSTDPKDMGIPLAMEGDAKDMERSISMFSEFREDYYLQPETCATNLNMVDLLNDNATTHFFSTKWIPSERGKYVFWMLMLIEIVRALESGKVKHPICLCIEEVKMLLPRTTEVSYQTILSDKLREMLAGLRSMGRGVTTISSTQNYMDTNKDFRSSATHIVVGKLNPEDQKALIRDFQLTREQSAMLFHIDKYEFLEFEALKNDAPMNPYAAYICPFALKEEKDPPFIDMWERHNPGEMRDLKPFINDMHDKREAAWQDQLAWQKEHQDTEQRKIDEKAARKTKKNNDDTDDDDEVPRKDTVALAKKVLADNKKEGKQESDDRAYNLVKERPKATWEELTDAHGYYHSVESYKKAVLRECVRRNDYMAMRAWFEAGFVTKNAPQTVDKVRHAL